MLQLRLRTAGEDEDWRSLLASYEQVVRTGDVVLEIGASVPDRTRSLAARCHKLIGVELFVERVPPDDGNMQYVVGDWQRLTEVIAPASVDVAVSSHVIEHVPDDLRALDELYAVLKPGGVALISTPNRKRLVRRVVERFTGERKFPWWEHVREYVEADLEDLISRSRFGTGRIAGVALGLHGGPVYCYTPRMPRALRAFANFWQLELCK